MKLGCQMLVGPGDAELTRLKRLLASLFLFSSGIQDVLLIDDSPVPRALDRLLSVPTSVRLRIIANERHSLGAGCMGGMCIGMLQGLKAWSVEASVDAVLKLDTDALVIAPFEEKIEVLLTKEVKWGTAGVVRHQCDGTLREWQPFSDVTEQLSKLVRWKRHPLLPRRVALTGKAGTLRRVLAAARRNGYEWGEHSQGGAYLISQPLIQAMNKVGCFTQGRAWADTFMSEDVMMGIYSRQCGFRNVECGRPGEIFGVSHIGLPFDPATLVELGYSIVHSTKNNPLPEEEIYEQLRNRSLASLE